MAKRITLTSQKGGAGKTTVALNLAATLADRGRRTLLVDLDPQGAIGLSLAVDDTAWQGLAERLVGAATTADSMLRTKLPALSILPRGRLDPLDIGEYEKALETPGLLEEVLDEAEGDFDYIIIDTPSGLGLVTRASLRASSWALVPLQVEPLAARSIGQVLRVVEHVATQENPELSLLGILPVMMDMGQAVQLDIMAEFWNGFAAVLESSIPRSAVFLEASHNGVPVAFLGGPIRPEVTRFEALTSEIEILTQNMEIQRGGADERPQRQLI